MRDVRIIRSRHLHKMQRRHFIIFDILPFVGTLVALGLLFYRPIGAMELGLFFGMWLMTGPRPDRRLSPPVHASRVFDQRRDELCS